MNAEQRETPKKLILTTSDLIPGCTITETLGLVRGSTVRARHLGHDIIASFKRMVGGEVDDYTKLLAEAREQAIDRLVDQARSKGATAVTCVRFSSAEIAQGAAEILIYGTAVKHTS